MLKLWIFIAIAVVPFVTPLPFSDEVNEDPENDVVIDDHFWDNVKISLSDDDWVDFGEAKEQSEGRVETRLEPYRLYNGQTKFALSLLNSTRHTSQKNLIFSPHSVYRALLLAYFGSAGKTKEFLESGLFLDWAATKSDVESAYDSEWKARASRKYEEEIEFSTVETLFVSKDVELNPNLYITQAFEQADFSDAEKVRSDINSIVEELTKNRIKDLLPEGSVTSATNMILTNAAYFRGDWATKFDATQTEKKLFNSAVPAEVEMMHVRGLFRYGVLEDAKAAFLELPYSRRTSSISMFVYLPFDNTPNAVDNLLDNLNEESVKTALNAITQRDVEVEFPKMSLSSSYGLSGVLKDMGIDNFFGFDSDFSDFSESTNLSFDDAIHKAVIEIDENGSVAAAATALVSRSLIFEPFEAVQFNCDHPFVFMINDRTTNEILFAGVYRGPN